MTLIVATPEKIYFDTRVTLKETLVDGMDTEHQMQLSYDGVCKLMSVGVNTPDSGAIHHTVGFGDIRVFKAINQILRHTGLDVFIDILPSLAKLSSKASVPSGLVWVDERGMINSIVREATAITHYLHNTDVQAFGHSPEIFNYLYGRGCLEVEEAFLLAAQECDYSSCGDYYVYDVGEKTYRQVVLEESELTTKLAEIKLKLATSLIDYESLKLLSIPNSRGFVMG